MTTTFITHTHVSVVISVLLHFRLKNLHKSTQTRCLIRQMISRWCYRRHHLWIMNLTGAKVSAEICGNLEKEKKRFTIVNTVCQINCYIWKPISFQITHNYDLKCCNYDILNCNYDFKSQNYDIKCRNDDL